MSGLHSALLRVCRKIGAPGAQQLAPGARRRARRCGSRVAPTWLAKPSKRVPYLKSTGEELCRPSKRRMCDW